MAISFWYSAAALCQRLDESLTPRWLVNTVASLVGVVQRSLAESSYQGLISLTHFTFFLPLSSRFFPVAISIVTSHQIRALSEHFQGTFTAVLEQFQSSFRLISEQFQSSFRRVSDWFQSSFRTVSDWFQSRFQSSLRGLLEQSWAQIVYRAFSMGQLRLKAIKWQP